MIQALKKLWAGGPRVGTARSFHDFLSEQAAYAAQKSVLGYCEVKSGRNRDKLFAEPEFKAGLERCRWESFAAVLADLIVLAETRLAPHAVGRERELSERLVAVYAAVLDAHPRPEHRPDGWEDAVAVFRARMAEVPRPAVVSPAEVARVGARRIMDTLPIHENHRREDKPAIVGAVQFHLVAAWDVLVDEVDAAAVAADLLAGA